MSLVSEDSEGSKPIQVIAIALGYLPYLIDKMLLLKTSYSLVTEHREINFDLTRKLPFWWPTSIVLEHAMGLLQEKI